MVDWLKANPSLTMNDYLWGISVCMAKVMAADATHTVFLSEKQAKTQKLINQRKESVTLDEQIENEDFLNDLGMPIFG